MSQPVALRVLGLMHADTTSYTTPMYLGPKNVVLIHTTHTGDTSHIPSQIQFQSITVCCNDCAQCITDCRAPQQIGLCVDLPSTPAIGGQFWGSTLTAFTKASEEDLAMQYSRAHTGYTPNTHTVNFGCGMNLARYEFTNCQLRLYKLHVYVYLKQRDYSVTCRTRTAESSL